MKEESYYSYIPSVDSTNRVLKSLLREQELPEGFVLRTDFQESGRGQGSNCWESQKGKNLLVSILLRPEHIVISDQFIISQLTALSILTTLKVLLPEQARAFTLKWPNDIYWNDRKLGGILIENILRGNRISACIIGIGLNINQQEFHSDAPNPVSLQQITGCNHARMMVLHHLMDQLMKLYHTTDESVIRDDYFRSLYRREGYFRYCEVESGREFEAFIVKVETDGRLVLKEKTGEVSGFYFKEVQFIP